MQVTLIITVLYLIAGISYSYEKYKASDSLDLSDTRSMLIAYLFIPSLWLFIEIENSLRRFRVWYRRKRALNNGKFINNY